MSKKYLVVAVVFSLPLYATESQEKVDKGNVITGIESNTYLIQELRKHKDPRKAMEAFKEYQEGKGNIAKKEEGLRSKLKADLGQFDAKIKEQMKDPEVLKKLEAVKKQLRDSKVPVGG